jgi:hypothetical protein
MGTGSPAVSPLPLHECKVRASLLLKDLASPDSARATRAAERLRQVPPFAGLSLGEVLARKDSVRRKHVLTVIAREQGQPSWSALKQELEAAPRPGFDTELFFARDRGGFLNHWFSTYEQAAASLQVAGGYLFPFRTQFFVCEAGFLKTLGVDTADPDWQRMGRDWVRPREPAARARLEAKLLALATGGRHVER